MKCVPPPHLPLAHAKLFSLNLSGAQSAERSWSSPSPGQPRRGCSSLLREHEAGTGGWRRLCQAGLCSRVKGDHEPRWQTTSLGRLALPSVRYATVLHCSSHRYAFKMLSLKCQKNMSFLMKQRLPQKLICYSLYTEVLCA